VKIRADLRRHIVLRIDDVPPRMTEMICSALTIPNEEKEMQQREGVPGWQRLPDTIALYKQNRGELRLPRGFAHQLVKGASHFGVEIDWRDDREEVQCNVSNLKAIALRPHQGPAAQALINNEQGIYQAPPGSGKTVTVLELWRLLGQRCLVIVDKTNLVKQWQDRTQQFLGVFPGSIGGGDWIEEDITIATIQTLWSRRESLETSDWWREWGMVVVDECHHVPANTLTDIVQRFPARYRFGASATPDRGGSQLKLAQAVLGPIVHRTPKDELRDQQILVTPKVRVVTTQFGFDFHPTIKDAAGRVRERNNYPQLVKALGDDDDRAALVARCVLLDRNHHHLVISRHLAHLQKLKEAIVVAGWDGPLYDLTGSVSAEDRMAVMKCVEEGNESVTFSTIADEAVDVPRWDRLHLTFPTRKTYKITQQVGRVERYHPLKKDAIVYDYRDRSIGVLNSQFAARVKEVYVPEGFEIEGL
jgi:superfamily II DNA or RNA helicase